jgi:hypothetical protein
MRSNPNSSAVKPPLRKSKIQPIYAFLRFGLLPAGLILVWLACALPLNLENGCLLLVIGRLFGLLLGVLTALLGASVIHNVYFSYNHARINPLVSLETWAITHDRMHNSNADLTWFRDAFFLVHAASPHHFGSAESEIHVKRSNDGLCWEQVAVIKHGDDDVRDPKLAVIGGKLFLYILLNHESMPLPHTTCVTSSDDGITWPPLAELDHPGWLFSRPKTRDGKTWYAPAYWHKFHHNALFTTSDGTRFEMLASITRDRLINEPEIEFLDDDRLLATGRADYFKTACIQVMGSQQSSTVICIALPPYTSWQETAETHTTRLDGPVMFRHNRHIYAIGRSHPVSSRAIFPRAGSVFGKKRTAIFEVLPTGLTHITDLPSCGDTSYGGVVIKDDFAYIAYYTNDVKHDFIWLLGMIEKTEIRMVKIKLDTIEYTADKLLNGYIYLEDLKQKRAA